MKDRFDHEVFVGCTVAYPGRASSRCWISTGRVIEIDLGEGRRGPRLRLEGGGAGATDKLKARWIGFNDQVLVMGS